MKNTDIQKIRQLLTEIKTAAGDSQRNVFFFLKADQALALLPCETCNCIESLHLEGAVLCPDCQPEEPICEACGGTKEKEVTEMSEAGLSVATIPCPDCQQHQKVCAKEGACTRYMDGTCKDCPDYQ